MDWNELFLNILYICITCIAPTIALFLVKYLQNLIKTKNEKIENEMLREYITDAEESVLLAVFDVFQTYVDGLKRAGKFDTEAHAIAKQMAIDKAITMITINGRQAVETLYGDFNMWLDTNIESVVKKYKQEKE